MMIGAYARVIKRSVAVTAAVAAAMIAISAGTSGGRGALGAVIGVAVVAVFFGISVLVVGRAAKISPQVMMAAAMVSYIVKFIAFAVVLIALQKSTAFSDRMLGFTALACILTWCTTQVVTTLRLKMLYVEPAGEHRA
jgi:ATP synthase protein I